MRKDLPVAHKNGQVYAELLCDFMFKRLFGSEENKAVAEKMKTVFAEWIDNGHNNFEDRNTCILRIELTEGILFSMGTRYDIDFTK